MSHTDDDVRAAVQQHFAGHDAETILQRLSAYGRETWEPEVPRVRVAIVELSGGRIDKLQELVAIAKVDYRDVLAWKQLGPLPAAEGERLQAEVRAVLKKWGGGRGGGGRAPE